MYTMLPDRTFHVAEVSVKKKRKAALNAFIPNTIVR